MKSKHGPVSRQDFLFWIRVFLVVVTIGIIILGFFIYKVERNSQDNRRILHEQASERANAHNLQVTENQNLQKQIGDALCGVTDFPPSTLNPRVEALRVKYKCVGGMTTLKPATTTPPTPGPTPSATRNSSKPTQKTSAKVAPGAIPTRPEATFTVTTARTLPRATLTATRTATKTIQPTATKTVVKPPTTTAPAGILKTPICLLGVVCIP